MIVESKLVCGDRIENFFIKMFATNGTVEDETSVSDDYYDLMSAKFLVNEYERTKVYLQDLQALDKVAWDVLRQKERITEKIKLLEIKISDACKLIESGLDEEVPKEIPEKIEYLLENVVDYQARKERKLKSKVQSFELTDQPNYEGIRMLIKCLEK